MEQRDVPATMHLRLKRKRIQHPGKQVSAYHFKRVILVLLIVQTQITARFFCVESGEDLVHSARENTVKMLHEGDV